MSPALAVQCRISQFSTEGPLIIQKGRYSDRPLFQLSQSKVSK